MPDFTPPSKEEPTTLHGQDTTEKILEYRGEAEAPPSAQRAKPYWKGKRNSSMLPSSPSSPSGHSSQLRPALSQWSRQWKKSPKDTSSFPNIVGLFLGGPHSSLSPGELLGNLGALALEFDSGRRGTRNNPHRDHGRLSSYLRHPRGSPQTVSLLTYGTNLW